jgi:hypothetical protein
MTFDEFQKICEDAGIPGTQAELELDFRISNALGDVIVELEGATSKFPAFNSAHEGFGVLKEEVDELWDEVKKKQGARDIERMRKEAIQVAAMALRFVADVCYDGGGQN